MARWRASWASRHSSPPLSALTLPLRNPQIAGRVAFIRSRAAEIAIALLAVAVLLPLLVLEIALLGRASSVFWLAAMLIGGAIFVIMWMRARAMGEDLHKVFSTLPEVAEEEESEEL